MRIRVLGSSGSDMPGRNLPAFLIDHSLLLDAGTIGSSLTVGEQRRITHILLTHSHLDHIRALPFLLDNMVAAQDGYQVTLMSGADVLDDVRKSLFNDRIWPDFTRIPGRKRPALRFRPLGPDRSVTIDGVRIECERMNHSVPSYGFIMEKRGRGSIAYTGDTGPTTLFWERLSRRRVDCLIVEASFPSDMEALALKTAHLTPSLLRMEIAKIRKVPARICVTHIKPQYERRIRRELAGLGMGAIEILSDGQIIEL